MIEPFFTTICGVPVPLRHHEGKPWVPMRLFVESTGLNWMGQYKKLIKNPKKFGTKTFKALVVLRDGREQHQRSVCIPLDKFTIWLDTININRVSDKVISVVIQKFKEDSKITA